jgi:hypothetical protein
MDYVKAEFLIERVQILGENSGIENQIYHLAHPDDNEIFESVFCYLSDHITRNIHEWTKVLIEIEKVRCGLG